MTVPKSKYPLDSFGPELMQSLLRGGRERFVITFAGPEGKKKAHKFQHRIHTLRSRMREENHDHYPLAARVRVSIFWGSHAVKEGAPKEWETDEHGKRGALIVIRPNDSEFDEVIAALKSPSTPSIEAEPTRELPPPDDNPHSPAPTLEDLFTELGDDNATS